MVCAIGGLQKSGKFTCSGDTFQGCWLLLILMIVSTQKYGKCEKCIADVQCTYLATSCASACNFLTPISYQNSKLHPICMHLPERYMHHYSSGWHGVSLTQVGAFSGHSPLSVAK